MWAGHRHRYHSGVKVRPHSGLFFFPPGETLKEQQVPRQPRKPSSSVRLLRDLKETMSNILHSRTLSSSSSSSSSSSPAGILSGVTSSTNNTAPCSSSKTLDRSKSCCSGGAASGRWRPRREVLNIDSIFTRDKRKQGGYSLLGPEGGAPEASRKRPQGSSWTLPTTFSSQNGAPAEPSPSPLPQKLIQRMESGYESSERNSSPTRLDLNSGEQ